MALAVGERARVFKSLSPGMLPPLGILYGLLVAFLAAQVWSDLDRANAAVNREASALRDVVLLAARFPGEPEAQMDALVRRHIEAAATQEWPMMARQRATLAMIPAPLAEGLQLALSLTPRGNGQVIAQREIVTALQNALDARRQRIINQPLGGQLGQVDRPDPAGHLRVGRHCHGPQRQPRHGRHCVDDLRDLGSPSPCC